MMKYRVLKEYSIGSERYQYYVECRHNHWLAEWVRLDFIYQTVDGAIEYINKLKLAEKSEIVYED